MLGPVSAQCAHDLIAPELAFGEARGVVGLPCDDGAMGLLRSGSGKLLKPRRIFEDELPQERGMIGDRSEDAFQRILLQKRPRNRSRPAPPRRAP